MANAKLTPGDWLFINRKRRRKSIAAEAKRWKTTPENYEAMELDKVPVTVDTSGIIPPTYMEMDIIKARPGRDVSMIVPPTTRPASGMIKVPKSAFKAKGFKREARLEVPADRARPKKHRLHNVLTCVLKGLTTGEALVLHRRRLDESQMEAAKRLGVGRKLYALWEIEVKELPGAAPDITEVADHEIAFIMRRRANKSRADMVEAVGFNRTWITAMERGDMDCSPLTNYWKA